MYFFLRNHHFYSLLFVENFIRKMLTIEKAASIGKIFQKLPQTIQIHFAQIHSQFFFIFRLVYCVVCVFW